MKNKKFLAHSRKLIDVFKKYVACLVLLTLACLCICACAHASEVESGASGAGAAAFVEGLQWSALSAACISLPFIGWGLFYLDGVECAETSINYYRWIFSKQGKEIAYGKVTDCVFSDGTWRRKKQNLSGVSTRFFKDEEQLLSVDSHPELCLELFRALGGKVKIVDHDRECVSLDEYFKTDFKGLTVADQVKCLQCYCDWYRTEYKTAEEIVKRERPV